MKKVKSIVGLLLISLILTPTLSAATFTHKLSGGVDEMYYYVNSSISSYTSEINDAVYKVDSNSNRDIINKYGWYKKGKL